MHIKCSIISAILNILTVVLLKIPSAQMLHHVIRIIVSSVLKDCIVP